MAQNISPKIKPGEFLAIDLRRALSRLEHKILSSPPNSRLQRSSHERTKTAANLEYARGLLLRLEQESTSIKIQSRKQAAQSTLLHQRALLKRMTSRLHELDELDTSDDDSASSSSEDLLAAYTSTTKAKPPPTAAAPQSPVLDRRKETSPHSTLRNRHPSAHPAQPPTPFSTTTTTSIPPLLESSSQTQAALTSSLLTLATALKDSSLAISSSLAQDAEALSRATDGLDRNATGMQAAGQRMGLLKRMTEGKGWWGRMMLYAWIAGLWVLALALVFVGPKLRF